MSSPEYLVHSTNGRIFAFTKELARRNDLIAAADLDEAQAMAEKRGAKPIKPKAHRLPNPPRNVTAPTTTPVDSKELADQKAENEALRAQLAELQAKAGMDTHRTDGETETQDGEDGDTFVISEANKDELETFAKEQFGVDLDKRKKVDDLRKQVRELAEGQTEGEGE